MSQFVMREAQALKPVQPPNYLGHYQAIDPSLSSGLDATHRALRDVLKRANGVIARRAMVDPRMTYGANLFAVERATDDFVKYAEQQFGAAQRALTTSTREAEAKLKATIGISPTPSARALQDRLAGMPDKQRVGILMEAFASGDKELLGAVVEQHPLLHRCDVGMITELLDRYQQKHAPKEYASVAAHQQAQEYLEKSVLLAMAFTARAYSGTEVAAAKRREIAAVLATYGMGLDDPAPNGTGFSGEPEQADD